MEDRCVEDVIDRQRNRRRFLLLNNSSAAAAKQEEEEETELCPDWLDVEAAGNGGGMVTADITPVPSRCITNPGSLVVEGEMGCSMEESKPLGRSAPAIVHVV
jgi:hypothetical protein